MPPKKPVADKGPSKKTEMKKKEKVIEVRSYTLIRNCEKCFFPSDDWPSKIAHFCLTCFNVDVTFETMFHLFFRIKHSAWRTKKVRRTKSLLLRLKNKWRLGVTLNFASWRRKDLLKRNGRMMQKERRKKRNCCSNLFKKLRQVRSILFIFSFTIQFWQLQWYPV